ncbi:MAG: DinB family protein [Mucilaginibacter sp.]|nr:DinB family protein [Mucilaginibacter sp.]
MNLLWERQTIDNALKDYARRLNATPEDKFSATPPSGGWSYAEVYAHILKTSIGITGAIDQCNRKELPPSKKGLSPIGIFMLGFERFPPFKVKQPEEIGEQFSVGKISRHEAAALLKTLQKELDHIAADLASAEPQYRFSHPRMGMLNAQQWYKFIRIHTLHHLKQLDGIERELMIRSLPKSKGQAKRSTTTKQL